MSERASQKGSVGLWGGALVAGLFGGLGDGLALIRRSALAPDANRELMGMAVSLVGALAVASAAAVGVGWLAPRLGWERSRWTGFCAAAVAWTSLCVAAVVPSWGALLPLVVGLGVLPTLVQRPVGRPRMVSALVFLALLAVVVADDRRPRAAGPPPASPGPDLVVVVVDGLRADQLGRVPVDEQPAMPHLQELAAAGTRFTHASSPATTASGARSAALLGRPPWTPATDDRWAHALSKLGFSTAIFGGPELAELAEEAGFSVRDVETSWPPGLRGGTPGRIWERLFPAEAERRSARRVAAAWTTWLQSVDPARPAASVLHLTDLSWPTRPAPPWDTAFERAPKAGEAAVSGPCAPAAAAEGLATARVLRAAYDGAAGAVDEVLGAVAAAARERPRGAVVVVTGSRGTPLGEGGLWLDAAGSIHPVAARIPIVITGPGVPQGSLLSAPTSTVDVVATIRALNALPAVADARPLPGLVHGESPRETAWTVGVDASVAALTSGGLWMRRPDGRLLRWEQEQWAPTDEQPDVPVPLLAAVPSEPSPCGSGAQGEAGSRP